MNLFSRALSGLLVLSIFVISCKRKIETDRGKASYAIGVQMAENFRQQDLDLDLSAFHKGIDEGYAQKSRFTKAELQEALSNMQQTAAKKQIEENVENKKRADDFLKENKKQSGVKITKSGLQYIVEKEGSGARPKAKDIVKFHYTGKVAGGEKFDSSYDRGEPATIAVSGTIAGWTEAFQMMKVGEKIKLFVPPDLGYGTGIRPGIPPNSVLIYELELLDIEKK